MVGWFTAIEGGEGGGDAGRLFVVGGELVVMEGPVDLFSRWGRPCRGLIRLILIGVGVRNGWYVGWGHRTMHGIYLMYICVCVCACTLYIYIHTNTHIHTYIHVHTTNSLEVDVPAVGPHRVRVLNPLHIIGEHHLPIVLQRHQIPLVVHGGHPRDAGGVLHGLGLWGLVCVGDYYY